MKGIIGLLLILASFEVLAVVPPPCLNDPGHPSCNAINVHGAPENDEVQSVPESGLLALVGAGLAGVFLMRRFRK
jgi:hypothetical protein